MIPDRIADVTSVPDATTARLVIERTRVESLLRMLEGNTHPEDIKRLHREWLVPILDRLQELQRERSVVVE